MDPVILDDINDVLKREKLFKKHAMKYLLSVNYKKPDTDFKSELLRTQKELDDLEKEYVDVDNNKKIQKNEKKIQKNIKKIEEDEDSDEIEFEPELSRKERQAKNKKKYPTFLTKGKKKREVKSRKKANRRKRN